MSDYNTNLPLIEIELGRCSSHKLIQAFVAYLIFPALVKLFDQKTLFFFIKSTSSCINIHVIIIVVSDPPESPTPSGDLIGTSEVSVPFKTKQALSNGERVRSVW